MEPIIRTVNLHKVFRMGQEKVHALNGVNLSIDRGEFVAILGTSGSGKSTLLNMLAGLEKPSKGEIHVGGVALEKLNERQLAKFRQLNIGFVFQSYHLIPTLTAQENVALGLIFKGVPRKKRDAMAKNMLANVGLANRMKHKPSELSGGQQQRVSIARAFVDQPKIVFADEPTGNLDSRTSEEVMELIRGMATDFKQTLVMVTHDEDTALHANRIFHIIDGKLDRIQTKTKEETHEITE
ncbi:MAG: ABC transporter ATP-binding protein [Tissierellia bacterium]|nr:ABC transporter ATP-binding protein [Tissierellia bacterium]